MNLKKLKRLASIMLSLTMVLSTNMTSYATEMAASGQESAWQLDTEIRDATTDEAGISRYVSKDGSVLYGATTTAEAAHEHVLVVDESQSVAATCGEDGVEVKVCECGYSEKETTEATGDHTEEDILDEAANEVVTSCTVCGKELGRVPYGDNNGAMPLAGDDTAGDTTGTVTPDTSCTNHSLTLVSRQDSDCWTEGWVRHYKCDECGKIYRTADAREDEDVPEESVKIAKKNHKATRHFATAPTCTEPGNDEYFTCDSCGRAYETMDDLLADIADGRTIESGQGGPGDEAQKYNQDEANFQTDALGHSYEDGNGDSTCEFSGWDSFDFAAYKEGGACGITASRACSRECGHTQNAESVAVTKGAVDPSFDCTAGGDSNTVEYTAVATFAAEEGTDAVTTETDKQDLLILGHAYKYEFSWPEDLLTEKDGKLAYQEDKTVTVTRTCNICEKTPEAGDTVDAGKVELTEGGKTEPYTLSCLQEGPFEFTATANYDDETVAQTDTHKYLLPIGRHQLERVDGEPASCGQPGSNEYFKCQTCGGKFWDEDDAFGKTAQEGLADSDITIAAYGHNFGLPVFSFVENIPAAKGIATFTCLRCSAGYTKECTVDLESKDWENENPDATCGEAVTVRYTAEVMIDRDKIVENADGTFAEDDTSEDYSPIKQTGYARQAGVVLKHEFSIKEDTLAWNDTPDANKNNYCDPEDGATATLLCGICDGEITFDSKAGTATPDVNSGITVSEGTAMTVALDPESKNHDPADCQKQGTDAYKVTIKGATTEEGSATAFDLTEELLNTTPIAGHKYIISNVEVSNPTTTVAPIINKMTIDCNVDGCDFEPVEYTKDSSISGLTVTPTIAKETVAGKNGYTPATCTEAGNIVWVADIQVTGEDNLQRPAYISYDENDQGTPWTKEVDNPALGHDYATNNPAFDWSLYGEVSEEDDSIVLLDNPGDVYIVYTCANENCTGEADSTETSAVDGTTYMTDADNHRVKRVVAEVAPAEITDCTSASGTRDHVATLPGDSSVKNTKKEALSGEHVWGDIVWADWEVDETEPKIEDETRGEIPNYTVTASRTCKICGEEESFRLADDTSDGLGIVITPVTEEETCTAAGSTIYWAKVVLAAADDATGTAEEAVECDTPHVEVYKATGHKFDIDWTWYGKVKGSEDDGAIEITGDNEKNVVEYTGATAQKFCMNCPKTIALDPEYGEGGIQFTKPTTEVTCVDNDVFTYTASARFTDDADDEYTETRKVIRMKTGHDYEWTFGPDWEAVEGQEGKFTTTVNGVCKNNTAHEDGPHANITVSVSEDDYTKTTATCMEPSKILATGTFELNGVTYTGTYTQEGEEVDANAHHYAPVTIDWEKAVLTKVESDDPEKVVYEIEADVDCDLSEDVSHNTKITVVATALATEVAAIDCSKNYSIQYDLAFEDPEDAAKRGITLQANSDTVSHTAGKHNLTRVSEKIGTCVSEGHSAYYICDICGRTYSNIMATNEINIVPGAALGHQYGDPVFVWNEEGKTVNAVFNCTRPGCQSDYAGHTRIFEATLHTGDGEVFYDPEPECIGTGEPGTAYYSVDLIWDEVPSGEFKNGTAYYGDISATVPAGNHVAGEDSTICKWCEQSIADAVTVSFKVDTNELSKASYAKTTAAESIVLPTAPNRSGYTFDGWKVGTSADTLAGDALKAKIAEMLASSTDIIVTAVYSKIETKGSITVTFMEEISEEDAPGETIKRLEPVDKEGQVLTGTIGAYVEVEPIEIAGLYFSYWASDGVKLTTDDIYSVYIQSAKPIQLQAVYVADESEKAEAAPTVVMSNSYRSVVNETNKVSFVAAMNIPENYSLVKSGILYSVDTKFADGSNKSLMVVGSSDNAVYNKAFSSTDGKTNILTMTVGASTTTTVYARGYVICKGTEGTEVTVYADQIASGSFETLPDVADAQ